MIEVSYFFITLDNSEVMHDPMELLVVNEGISGTFHLYHVLTYLLSFRKMILDVYDLI